MTSMTAQDREAFKEMVEVALTSLDGKFEMITYKLNEIKEQTTKTNGRVTKLEEKELLHVVNCPQSARLDKLEKTDVGNASVNKWLLRVLAVSGSLVAIGWAIVQIVDKIIK